MKRGTETKQEMVAIMIIDTYTHAYKQMRQYTERKRVDQRLDITSLFKKDNLINQNYHGDKDSGFRYNR